MNNEMRLEFSLTPRSQNYRQNGHSYGDLPIDVLIAEDNSIFSDLVKIILTRHSDLIKVTVVSERTHLISKIKQQQPKIILFDYLMSVKEPSVITEIRAILPDIRIIIMSSYPPSIYWHRNIINDIDGLIYKCQIVTTLLPIIKQAMRIKHEATIS